MSRTKTGPLTLTLLLVAACGGTAERPTGELAGAEAGIRQAEQGGAGQYGALELQNARDKLERARAAAEQDEMQTAARLAEQAALDAELAAAKTRSRKAELALEELENSIAVLEEEIDRRGPRAGDPR